MADLTTNEYRGLARGALNRALQREARAIGILGRSKSDTGEFDGMSLPPARSRHLERGPIASLFSLLRLFRGVHLPSRVVQHRQWRT